MEKNRSTLLPERLSPATCLYILILAILLSWAMAWLLIKGIHWLMLALWYAWTVQKL